MSKYIGNELEVFRHATNWKKYFSTKLKSFISGDVLEIGAGIGGTYPYLVNNKVKSWTFLEPDPTLIDQIPKSELKDNIRYDFINDYSTALPKASLYHSIVYIDVLEHINNDLQELNFISEHLQAEGYIVSLSPAHSFLYNEFDKNIGHFRRYNKKMIKALKIDNLQLVEVFYLDSIGLFASIANKYLLKQSIPSSGQIKFWDNVIVPISKIADKITCFFIGKSIVAIWKKAPQKI